jgi:hypothetical protein
MVEAAAVAVVLLYVRRSTAEVEEVAPILRKHSL